jgi:hypothetical protein
MKQRIAFVLLVFVCLLVACSKSSSNNDEVFIRVENATAEGLSDFNFMGTSFGSINAGDTTGYKQFQKVLPYPFANLISINNNYLYIVDIVPTPYLSNGKYVLQLLTDSVPYNYKASFIKE